MRFRSTNFFLLALSAALVLMAQTPTAQITGRLTDTSGAVVPSVHIEIVNKDTGVKREVVSNEVGYYVAPLLQPGAPREHRRGASARPLRRANGQTPYGR